MNMSFQKFLVAFGSISVLLTIGCPALHCGKTTEIYFYDQENKESQEIRRNHVRFKIKVLAVTDYSSTGSYSFGSVYAQIDPGRCQDTDQGGLKIDSLFFNNAIVYKNDTIEPMTDMMPRYFKGMNVNVINELDTNSIVLGDSLRLYVYGHFNSGDSSFVDSGSVSLID